MNQNHVVLADGILNRCFEKVRRNFYDRIDAQKHAEVYEGVHDRPYAEPEFTGKFLDLCAYYYETEKDPRALEKGMTVVKSIQRNQRADGYLGCLEAGKELVAFSVWNHGFTLYGLTRMYEATGDESILEIARRGADWILRTYERVDTPDILEASNAGSQNISCMYAIGRFYLVTKEKKYLKFLENVLRHCETTDMNLLSFQSIFDLRSQKGIEMLVVYLGVLQYGHLSGDATVMEAVHRYWDEIWKTQIRNTGNGTVEEKWTRNGNAPKLMATEEKPNETCVAVGWIELSLALFHVFQRAEYLDAVEKTLFNHMIGSLEKSGEDFAYYQGNYGKKIYRTDDGAYQCCRYRGFTLFTYLKEYLYHYDNGCLTPTVYASSQFCCEDVLVEQSTQYPADGALSFRIENPNGNLKSLRLRIPVWCEQHAAECDGVKAGREKDGFLWIDVPQGNSRILVSFEMVVRLERHMIAEKPYATFHYGPLLLAHDIHFGGSLEDGVSEMSAEALFECAEGLSLVRFRYGDMTLVDFASAGGNAPAKDEYTVFIPMVE